MAVTWTIGTMERDLVQKALTEIDSLKARLDDAGL